MLTPRLPPRRDLTGPSCTACAVSAWSHARPLRLLPPAILIVSNLCRPASAGRSIRATPSERNSIVAVRKSVFVQECLNAMLSCSIAGRQSCTTKIRQNRRAAQVASSAISFRSWRSRRFRPTVACRLLQMPSIRRGRQERLWRLWIAKIGQRVRFVDKCAYRLTKLRGDLGRCSRADEDSDPRRHFGSR